MSNANPAAPAAIATHHADLGEIIWDVAGQDQRGNLFLFARPLPEPRAFYDPSLYPCARYIRTDYAGRGAQDAGRLLEVQEKGGADGGVAARYADIMEYGCHQWAVSSLRAYLNGEFLHGFDADFRQALVPTAHSLLLGAVPHAGGAGGTRTRAQSAQCGASVYDEFGADGVRRTWSDVTDLMFLPGAQDMEGACAPFFRVEANRARTTADGAPAIYWRMDAQIDSSGSTSLVRVTFTGRNLRGELYTLTTSNNARYPQRVCPMCVIRADSPMARRK